MDLASLAAVFGVVFLAELPDKTALATLILGSRHRPSFVFAGVAAAFVVHTALAVTAGGLLALLPHRVVAAVVAVLFAAGGVLMLRGRGGEEANAAPESGPAGFWRVAGTSFAVIVVAEFGDLTQVVIVSLAARYHAPLPVGVASVLALWAAAGVAIAGGRGLLRLIPLVWVTRAAAAVMLLLAGFSLVDALG